MYMQSNVETVILHYLFSVSLLIAAATRLKFIHILKEITSW